jgi:electron transport complex protein RnfE
MSAVREILGAGSIAGIAIPFLTSPATIMILPAGGFLTLGCIIAVMQKLLKKGE